MSRPRQVLLAVDAANHAIDARENGARMNYGVSVTYAARLGVVKRAGFY